MGGYGGGYGGYGSNYNYPSYPTTSMNIMNPMSMMNPMNPTMNLMNPMIQRQSYPPMTYPPMIYNQSNGWNDGAGCCGPFCPGCQQGSMGNGGACRCFPNYNRW
ncbi:hypothetical protein JAAARDRAFT_35875 [Jaapia argillacea MUCL 33604]|uniref:Uncharacterized protein n=1 Tax=Jaapia argillacea MUCL 33604 TaxID=933084 RepID=A0A067Q3T7_9AGAM|nr:hypothetical protein JAAARDRAFT_35875 [Jaapia argillacea MUCL 33604]